MNKLEINSHLEKVKSSLMWDYRFPIDKEEAEKIITEDRRIICTINNEYEFNCGLIPDGKGNYFINVNKEIRSKLALEEGDKVHLLIYKDQSKYGMPVPDSFQELLYQDPEGEKYFNSLSPGKIRSLLYVIGKPKSEQKQLEKGLVILDYLKEVEGVLDFKELSDAMKSNRFK
jgi:hypothetical protein